eukprot:13780841-Alexandrium_andersonii.AAC.1
MEGQRAGGASQGGSNDAVARCPSMSVVPPTRTSAVRRLQRAKASPQPATASGPPADWRLRHARGSRRTVSG